MVLVGYMKAGLWVSSTRRDLDVFVSLRVLDDHDREIRYESLVPPIDPANIHPVGHGLLKVSHRALDDKIDGVLAGADAPRGGLPAARRRRNRRVEVGLYPSSALIRKGSRLRIDVQPYSPAGPSRTYDESYHAGASNTVYTGPDHPSYVQLPIVPQN